MTKPLGLISLDGVIPYSAITGPGNSQLNRKMVRSQNISDKSCQRVTQQKDVCSETASLVWDNLVKTKVIKPAHFFIIFFG